jgi:pyridoxine kinase
VPTVLLPWHPGQGSGTRVVLDAANFRALVGDLAKSPKLAEVGAVLTGYFADASQVATAAVLMDAVTRVNPAAVFLVDPVIGDDGRRYVAEPVAAAIRDKLVPFAEILTPNVFELGYLTGAEAPDNAAIIAAARTLGTAEVVVTSANSDGGRSATLLVTQANAFLASHRAFANPPHGTGDILAALYLGNRLGGKVPADALRHAAAATLHLIESAVAAGADELPLAAAQNALFAPPSGVTVTRM